MDLCQILLRVCKFYKQVFTGAALLSIMVLLNTKPAFAHSGHGSELMQKIIQQNLTPNLVIAGLGIGFLFGAGHALAPGHGKTMVTAYLVGSQGTPQQAILLGLVTTIAHTASIFALGLLALFASQYIVPEQLYPVLSFLSGFTICGVGFWLLASRLENQSEHNHHHQHSSEESITLRSLIAVGIAGGIAPCPSALILLLSAVALHKAVYGMLLISAFSLGLASVLVTLGLLAIYAYQWLERFPTIGKLQNKLSIVSAILIIATGILLSASAVN